MIIDALVEGITDEAVARRIVAKCGHDFGISYRKKGHDYIRQKIAGFNTRATYDNPILALVDFMDTGFTCVPEVSEKWLPEQNANMILRLVVPELESWLMADAEGLAAFLKISKSRIPRNPEMLGDPKKTLVDLTKSSKSKAIREAIVPPAGYSSIVGPGYVDEIINFVAQSWNIEAAMEKSISLRRCIQHLNRLHNR